MHAVVKIDVSRAGSVPFYKFARAGTAKRVGRLVAFREICFGFYNDSSAASPNNRGADQFGRTPKRIVLKEISPDQLRGLFGVPDPFAL